VPVLRTLTLAWASGKGLLMLDWPTSAPAKCTDIVIYPMFKVIRVAGFKHKY
jgi:hypothetical protein